MLVIARDTTHAAQLVEVIQDEKFFEGRYRDKVIQVDSSKSGAEEEQMIQRLLEVEKSESPTEVVVHVNMLKEGWDVTNLYTIVPLRAANARTLIEQSIGRGLRLPYGQKTGVEAVDRLSIVAHDKFQELVDEARRPDSIVQLKEIVLDDAQLRAAPKTIVVTSRVEDAFGITPEGGTDTTVVGDGRAKPSFEDVELPAVKVVWDVIRELERRPELVPTTASLATPEVREQVLREVRERYVVEQPGLDGLIEQVDLSAIVSKATSIVVDSTISIPRIIVQPKGDVRSGFHPFTLDLTGLRLQPESEDLWLQYLRSGEAQSLTTRQGRFREERLEDYVVAALVDFDDVAYDAHSEMLYDLAGQVVRHFRSYLDEDQTERILRMQRRQVAQFVHAQMQAHYWEKADSYEVTVRAGFTDIKPTAFTSSEPTRDFRSAPPDRGNIAKYVFAGFRRCLQSAAKFQSDTERVLSIILDRESEKWFRPARGQFQLYYSLGGRTLEYQPDFVAETAEAVYMLEPKRRSDMEDPEVVAKKNAAVLWCQRATEHSARHDGKPWRYLLIPDNEIAENVSLDGLVRRFEMTNDEEPA